MKVLGYGVFNFDTIVKRVYPESFVPGKRNPFVEEVLSEEVGGTCGNVMCMLSYFGNEVYPVAHFDMSEQGLQLTKDLQHYGCDTRYVKNSEAGGTTLLRCTHRLNKATGEPEMGVRMTSPGSRFARRKWLRVADELPVFMSFLDVVPDVFFFDAQEASHRMLADAFRRTGTLVYFEPESNKEEKKFLNSVAVSDIVKFSGKLITDTSFCDNCSDKLFIQTLSKDGLRFNLRGEGWVTLPPVMNDLFVDEEGAGDWTTSAFINALGKRGLLKMEQLTVDNVRECLEEAQHVASRSVAYMGSKGMIHAEGKL